jgi:cytochrome c oxidase subunit II
VKTLGTKEKPDLRHFTTRPGFVIFVGLLVLSLYFVWAAYGAAPTSLSFLTETPAKQASVMPMAGMEIESAESMAMAGHGAGVGAMTPEKFEEITSRFIEDLSLPDGSVRPTREWMASAGGDNKQEEKSAAMPQQGSEAVKDEADQPIDVYLKAMRFSYEPRVLRLKRGIPYRFRVMSIDVNHGASIHTGLAGHIMRRPAKTLTEMVMTFSQFGEFMVYCTVYCGAGHDQMKGKIIVE